MANPTGINQYTKVGGKSRIGYKQESASVKKGRRYASSAAKARRATDPPMRGFTLGKYYTGR